LCGYPREVEIPHNAPIQNPNARLLIHTQRKVDKIVCSIHQAP
jgi:hypothetical protein